MTPSRDLLPGNADLADIVAQLPRERRGSSWDVVWMAIVSIALVMVALYVTPQFEQVFKEIGVQVPRLTEAVLHWWFHALALVVLAVPCVWRFRAGSGSWATEVWFLLAILYVGFVIVRLFMPMVILVEALDSSPGSMPPSGPEHHGSDSQSP
jgi:hypothetical protein